MWPAGVVLAPPALDEHLRLQERVELLSGQQLIPQLAVEALDVAVFPKFDRQTLKSAAVLLTCPRVGNQSLS